jgi:hypothetical protein
MEVTPPFGTPLDPPGYYRVTWSVTNVCPEGQAAELTSLTLNGEPVAYDPGPITTVNGTFLVPIGTPTGEWCINASNSCGHSVECCDEVPCCYKTSMVAIEARGFLAEYTKTCTQTRRGPDGGLGSTISETIIIRGLDQLNGTILKEPIELGGYDTAYSCQTLCHKMVYPIPLGVYGEVEWRQTWTDIRGGIDSCGEETLGRVTKYYTKWSGELLYSCLSGVETILLDRGTVQHIYRKFRTGPTFCPPEDFAPCNADSVTWPEDSDYCLMTQTTPFTPFLFGPSDTRLVVARMFDTEETMGPFECDRSSWYTGPCSLGTWCTAQVEALAPVSLSTFGQISDLCDYSSIWPDEDPTCSTSPYCIFGYAEMKPLYNA